MTATTVLGQRTKNTLEGRDAAYHGHPIRIADLLAPLGGTAYAARGSRARRRRASSKHEGDAAARVRDAARAARASRSSRSSRCARPAGSCRPRRAPATSTRVLAPGARDRRAQERRPLRHHRAAARRGARARRIARVGRRRALAPEPGDRARCCARRSTRCSRPASLLLTVTGRHTGRRYSIPVGYQRDGDDLVVMVSEARAQAVVAQLLRARPISVRLRGREIAPAAPSSSPPGSDEFRELADARSARARRCAACSASGLRSGAWGCAADQLDRARRGDRDRADPARALIAAPRPPGSIGTGIAPRRRRRASREGSDRGLERRELHAPVQLLVLGRVVRGRRPVSPKPRASSRPARSRSR